MRRSSPTSLQASITRWRGHAAGAYKQETIAEFKRDQDELTRMVREGDGLALDKVLIRLPFGGKIKHSCYSPSRFCLDIRNVTWVRPSVCGVLQADQRFHSALVLTLPA